MSIPRAPTPADRVESGWHQFAEHALPQDICHHTAGYARLAYYAGALEAAQQAQHAASTPPPAPRGLDVDVWRLQAIRRRLDALAAEIVALTLEAQGALLERSTEPCDC